MAPPIPAEIGPGLRIVGPETTRAVAVITDGAIRIDVVVAIGDRSVAAAISDVIAVAVSRITVSAVEASHGHSKAEPAETISASSVAVAVSVETSVEASVHAVMPMQSVTAVGAEVMGEPAIGEPVADAWPAEMRVAEAPVGKPTTTGRRGSEIVIAEALVDEAAAARRSSEIVVPKAPIGEAAATRCSSEVVIAEALIAEAAATGGCGPEVVAAEALVGETAAGLCPGTGGCRQEGAGEDCRCNRCDRLVHGRHARCVESIWINVAPAAANPASFCPATRSLVDPTDDRGRAIVPARLPFAT